VDPEVRLDRNDEFARDRLGYFGRVGIVDDHDKLVTTQARGKIRLTQIALQASREFDQDRVSGGVAQRVVDFLEVIDVEIEQRQRASFALSSRQCCLEAFAELPAICKAGKTVVAREQIQFALGSLEPGNIEQQHQHAFDAAVIIQFGCV